MSTQCHLTIRHIIMSGNLCCYVYYQMHNACCVRPSVECRLKGSFAVLRYVQPPRSYSLFCLFRKMLVYLLTPETRSALKPYLLTQQSVCAGTGYAKKLQQSGVFSFKFLFLLQVQAVAFTISYPLCSHCVLLLSLCSTTVIGCMYVALYMYCMCIL